MRVEEIVITAAGSERVDEPAPEVRVRDARLEQIDRARFGRFEFELFNRKRLSVKTQEAFRSARAYELDIGILEPRPTRALEVSWRYWLGFISVAAAAGSTAFVGPSAPVGALTGALAIGAATFLLLAIFRTRDRIVFFSRHGRVPLVILLNRKPDRGSFRTFIALLTQHIEQTAPGAAGASDVLSEELKEHRRLFEQGILSERRYDSVKRRILALHGSR